MSDGCGIRQRALWGACGGAALLLGAAGEVQAAPNGLNQIPIAQTYSDGVADVEYCRTNIGTSSILLNTQFGLSRRLTAGVDYLTAPAANRAPILNAKYLLPPAAAGRPAIAAGVQSVVRGTRSQPYVVATGQLKAVGLSLGALRPGPGSRFYGMVGVSYNLTPAVQLTADEIGDRANYGTVGVIAALGPRLSLTVAYAKPNTGVSPGPANLPGTPVTAGLVNPRGYFVDLAYAFQFRHMR